MESTLRIREATPSEIFADRLEREARQASSPAQAADYRRQAAMLREMAAMTATPSYRGAVSLR